MSEWKEPNGNQEKILSPQWICLTCKTVVGPVVDDDEHRCNCKDQYLVDLWLVAPPDEYLLLLKQIQDAITFETEEQAKASPYGLPSELALKISLCVSNI